jgi:hypothetical protein
VSRRKTGVIGKRYVSKRTHTIICSSRLSSRRLNLFLSTSKEVPTFLRTKGDNKVTIDTSSDYDSRYPMLEFQFDALLFMRRSTRSSSNGSLQYYSLGKVYDDNLESENVDDRKEEAPSWVSLYKQLRQSKAPMRRPAKLIEKCIMWGQRLRG